MSDVTPTPEEVTPPVADPVVPPPEEPTPPATTDTEDPVITDEDLQALVDKVSAEVITQEEPVPTSPQFAWEKDPLAETIAELDTLVDKTVALEQEKEADKATFTAQVTDLQTQVSTLQSKVDFVDTAFERIASTIWVDLATQIAKGELTDVPKYLIPWNMDKVLSDKILWPLVQARLEGRDINIPKFLGEIVASKKAALPNITSEPAPTPTKPTQNADIASEIARLSNQWF